MFHNIPTSILTRMKILERLDAIDRQDGTPQSRRLRQITPDTGRFIALLAASSPPGAWVEIGTSAGYSTLWLSLAARQVERKITTYDIDPAKVKLARETFHLAQVEELVELVEGDARLHLSQAGPIAFCFLDTEKEIYLECYELVVPRLVPGSWIVADNAISHQEELADFIQHVQRDERVDALIVPVGPGELICRKWREL
jgi:predicted O-methyltransferase YrrM